MEAAWKLMQWDELDNYLGMIDGVGDKTGGGAGRRTKTLGGVGGRGGGTNTSGLRSKLGSELGVKESVFSLSTNLFVQSSYVSQLVTKQPMFHQSVSNLVLDSDKYREDDQKRDLNYSYPSTSPLSFHLLSPNDQFQVLLGKLMRSMVKRDDEIFSGCLRSARIQVR